MGRTDEGGSAGDKQSNKRVSQVEPITREHRLNTVVDIVGIGLHAFASKSTIRFAAHTNILEATDNAGTYNCLTTLAEQHWCCG